MIYFISDVHLGLGSPEDNRKRERLLLDFLNKIKPGMTHLVIAGDLFDYWFEYTTVIPKPYFRTLQLLDSIAGSGIEIIYLMGNHDFGHVDFFENEMGIKIHKDDIVREFSGKKFYLSHGDGKAYNDLGYRMLKKIMRNPVAQWAFRKLHPDFGIWLARSSSSKSRQYTGKKDYGMRDGMKDFAEKRISEGFDFVVMGHRHKPELIQFGDGYYCNLGDWLTVPKYAVFDGKQLELRDVASMQ